ncbi:biotin/lipoyl-containing protein [Anaerophilus nitritogenes]|uniref:biotin/lipoyl-containing protein n=1 Tax=Anaerophilus nitritogenes TaxID=2498136 RepID=UPI00101C396A|nr:biotin/lipoyl-containing protein [Anaerophilus nitritogenes]
MKKFNITVNGNSYEVEVEEIKGGSSTPIQRPIQQPTQQRVSPPKVPTKVTPKAETVSAPKEVPAGANTVTAPMPGTILDLKVKQGDVVAKGQVLLILEAMKMENEIMSPSEGKIVSINTTKGASVNAGDVLVVVG